MARGNDPGKDFNDQWSESRRRGQEKAARGEGPWAEDKYLERINAKPRPVHHAAGSDSCLVSGLAFLGALAWVLSEIVSRIA